MFSKGLLAATKKIPGWNSQKVPVGKDAVSLYWKRAQVFEVAAAPNGNAVGRKLTGDSAHYPKTTDARTVFRSSKSLAIAEALLIVAIGVATEIGYSSVVFGEPGQVYSFANLSVLVAVLYCGSMRIVEGSQRLKTRLLAFRDELITWTGVFLFLSVLAFSMKTSASFSRGAVISFYVTGFVALELSRHQSPVHHSAIFPASSLCMERSAVDW